MSSLHTLLDAREDVAPGENGRTSLVLPNALGTGRGYFWPIWVMAGWGVGLVMHGYDVYFRRPITDADIDAEMRRSGQG